MIDPRASIDYPPGDLERLAEGTTTGARYRGFLPGSTYRRVRRRALL